MDEPQEEQVQETLRAVSRRVRVLTVAVIVLTLALVLNTAAVFGSLVNYFDGDVRVVAGGAIGAAVMGFLFGWFARSWA